MKERRSELEAHPGTALAALTRWMGGVRQGLVGRVRKGLQHAAKGQKKTPPGGQGARTAALAIEKRLLAAATPVGGNKCCHYCADRAGREKCRKPVSTPRDGKCSKAQSADNEQKC